MAATSAEIRAEFDLGHAAACDPANREAVRGGAAATTLHSPWLYASCRVCAHTFRVGDTVWIDEQGIVRHHSALLPCSGHKLATPSQPLEITAFFAVPDFIKHL